MFRRNPAPQSPSATDIFSLLALLPQSRIARPITPGRN